MKFKLNKYKLTLKEFEEFERTHELELPNIYKDIMLKYNGGIPEREYFEGGTVFFEAIKYGNYPLESIIINLNHYLPKGFFPFASYSGQYLCISLNEGDYGTIYFLDETGDYTEKADSLHEFINKLSDDEDY